MLSSLATVVLQAATVLLQSAASLLASGTRVWAVLLLPPRCLVDDDFGDLKQLRVCIQCARAHVQHLDIIGGWHSQVALHAAGLSLSGSHASLELLGPPTVTDSVTP